MRGATISPPGDHSSLYETELCLNRAETDSSAGFKDIPEGNIAYGLFDLSHIGLSNNYYYWLASHNIYDTNSVRRVAGDGSDAGSSIGGDYGIRPVVVLPSNIQFADVDNNTVLEIKEN